MSIWRAIRRFDLGYWFRSRFIPRYRHHVVNTGLEPGWHDVDERMLYACMALLCSYVEDEQGGADKFVGEPSSDDEALMIYRWWKVDRPADHAKYDEWVMRLFGSRSERDDSMGSVDELHRFQDEIEARDQDMLHRLIDIRRSLWT